MHGAEVAELALDVGQDIWALAQQFDNPLEARALQVEGGLAVVAVRVLVGGLAPARRHGREGQNAMITNVLGADSTVAEPNSQRVQAPAMAQAMGNP